jgi:hypothetical protein
MKSTPTRAGIAETQNILENGGDFENRPILNASDAGAILIHVAGDRGYAAADRFEGVQDDPGLVFAQPLGVVALLRHGPRVAHDNHRESLLNGFADAAGTRLADEEVAELHEIANVRGKPDHDSRRRRAHSPQCIRQRAIVAADQNELCIAEALCNATHLLGSMSAEHDDTRRSIRIEL